MLATPVKIRLPNKEQIDRLKEKIHQEAKAALRREGQVKEDNKTEPGTTESDSSGEEPK